MAIAFSNSVDNNGIVEQTRSLMRVDSSQWPTLKVANSSNNWLDFLDGYAIGADKRFQFDNTQHTKLPEGTTDLVSGQADYSFLTDEQGNAIVTLIGLSLVESDGTETKLHEVNRNDDNYDISTFGVNSGIPYQYDKIADNIIRLDTKASADAVSKYDLKFYFQRNSPKFLASSTTKTSGYSPLLDRGFVVASAYDGALTLGLPNLQGLGAERLLEVEKVKQYFAVRQNDVRPRLRMRQIRFK